MELDADTELSVVIESMDNMAAENDPPNHSSQNCNSKTCTPTRGKRYRHPEATCSPSSVIDVESPSVKEQRTSCIILRPSAVFPTVAAPSRSAGAIQVRAMMAEQIRKVYVSFVSEGHFQFTDMFEQKGLMQCPTEDPMGVVAAAVAIVHYVYNGPEAEDAHAPGMHMHLTRDARHYMAAALFLAYKAKSEDSWHKGNMPAVLLSRFVSELEYQLGGYGRVYQDLRATKMSRALTECEFHILDRLPTFSLLDFNFQCVFEHQIERLMTPSMSAGGTAVLSSKAGIAIMSCFGFYYQELLTDRKSESVELHVQERGLQETSAACVAFCCALIYSSGLPAFSNLIDTRLVFSMCQIISAADLLSSVRYKGVDPYLVPPNNPVLRAITSNKTMLHALDRLNLLIAENISRADQEVADISIARECICLED